MKTALIIIIVSQMSQAMTLKEAINTAFQKNPITKANDERLYSAEERAIGAKRNMYLSGSASVSASNNSIKETGESYSFRSNTNGMGASAGINLFRSGADYYRTKAAEAERDAIAASNNSTNSLKPDTKGALANDVADAYFDIVILREWEVFLAKKIDFARELLRAKNITQTERDSVNALISATTNRLSSIEKDERRALLSFRYHVKEDAKNLDNFEQIVSSLAVPKMDEALVIAKEKSPIIQEYKSYVERSRYNAEAQKASTGLSVDLGVRYSNSRTTLNPADVSFTDRGPSVSVTASLPLNWGGRNYTAAAYHDAQAFVYDLNKEESKLQHQVEDNLYPDLISNIDLLLIYKRTFNQLTEQIEAILTDIEKKEAKDVVLATQRLIDSWEGEFRNMLNTKISIAGGKFAIQRTIGILFDDIHLPGNEQKRSQYYNIDF